MSILKSLKLTAATPANPGASEHSFRTKLLRYLAEQRALAEAEIAGTPFQATKKVTRTNEAGEKVRVEAARAGSKTPVASCSSSFATAASRWNLPRA